MIVNKQKILSLLFTLISASVFAQEVESQNYTEDAISGEINVISKVDTLVQNSIIMGFDAQNGYVVYDFGTYNGESHFTFDYDYITEMEDTALVRLLSYTNNWQNPIKSKDYKIFTFGSDIFSIELDSFYSVGDNFQILIMSSYSKPYEFIKPNSNLVMGSYNFNPIQNNYIPYIISPNPTNGLCIVESKNGEQIQMISVQNSSGLALQNVNVNQISPTAIELDFYTQLAGVYSVNVLVNGVPHSVDVIKNLNLN